MIDFSTATIDELSVFDLALKTARIEHDDLDIPLIEELQSKVAIELSLRK